MTAPLTSLQKNVSDVCSNYGFTLTTPLTQIMNNLSRVEGYCNSHQHPICFQARAFVKQDKCKACDRGISNVPSHIEQIQNEIWKSFGDVEVSNLGRVRKNNVIRMKQKNDKGHTSYSVNRTRVSLSRMMAIAFEIEGYKKLLDQENKNNEWISTWKDPNAAEILSNIHIVTRQELASSITSKITKIDQFVEVPTSHQHLKYKILDKFPQYYIFEDGSVYNRTIGNGGSRFLTFNKSGSGNTKSIKNNDGDFKLSILMLMAFNPIDQCKFYDDYLKYNITHKDGNSNNFHYQNLHAELHKTLAEITQENVKNRIQNLHNKLNEFLKSRNATLISPLSSIKNVHDSFEMKCECSEITSKQLKDCDPKRSCNKCYDIKLYRVTDPLFHESSFVQNEERFERFDLGWVGDKGTVLDNFKTTRSVSKESFGIGKFEFNIKHLIAISFKLPNYEKLIKNSDTYDQQYQVFKKDKTQGYNINNLKVSTASEVHKLVPKTNTSIVDVTRVNGCKFMTHDAFPHLRFYENGIIYNTQSQNYLLGSLNNHGYRNYNYQQKTYKIHRLICFVFHPIEGYSTLDQYDNFQVDHIDGDKSNNHEQNLRWCTAQENINFAVEDNVFKSNKPVLQFKLKSDQTKGDFLAKYPTIKFAGESLKISALHIKRVCKGIGQPKYFWFEFENKQETNDASASKRLSDSEVSDEEFEETVHSKKKLKVIE